MLIDAHDLAPDAVLEADCCVVGAGAAGITLARTMAAAGVEVLLLEGGGRGAEPASQRLYDGSVDDQRLHAPPNEYRERRLGGSTTTWGGRCVPFDPIDFERRDWIPHSGWPFDAAALAPYYAPANEMLEAGAFRYRAGAVFSPPLAPLVDGFRSDDFDCDGLERFSRPTDLGARYVPDLAVHPRVRVVLHANVTRLVAARDGSRIERLEVATLRGRRLSATARTVVLATGGLEIPRLLLASPAAPGSGTALGNRHDVVGRYYMCHLAGTMGALRTSASRRPVRHGYDRDAEGVYCRRRIALTESAQRRLRCGNFIARLHHPRIGDPAHGTPVLSALMLARLLVPPAYRRRLVDGTQSMADTLHHVRNVLAGPHEVAGFAWHMLRDRTLAARKFPSIVVRPRSGAYSLDFHAEQVPRPDSRVTLSARERDPLGLPRLHLAWRYDPLDVETVRRALTAFQEAMRASGAGTFDFDPASVEMEMTRYGAYGGHHIGTARMGVDPRTSVVDGDGRVHGVANLYVAGAAVFPTSSQANPTLTIVALALRMADHLAGLARRGEVPAPPAELAVTTA